MIVGIQWTHYYAVVMASIRLNYRRFIGIGCLFVVEGLVCPNSIQTSTLGNLRIDLGCRPNWPGESGCSISLPRRSAL